MVKRILLVLILISIASGTAQADRRKYVWTYQYQTMPQGETELELYQTIKVNLKDSWEFRGEVEHGLTPRLDFSVYQIFSQKEEGSLVWNATQLRARYRIGEAEQYLVDPLIYLEYNRKTESTAPNKLEAKLILSKTLDRIDISLNPVYEYFFAPGQSHEIGFDGGVSYEFLPALAVGIESVSRIEYGDGESVSSAYFGPTISLASGSLWYSAGFLIGLNDNSDDCRIRLLMGVDL